MTTPSNSTHLGGVGVVSTSPGSSTAVRVVRIDDANDGSVRSSDEKESTAHNHENGPHDHGLPLPVAISATPVVVKPHASHGLEAHEGTQQGADERHKTTENGDCRRDDVRDEGDAAGEAEPDDPVLGGVVVQVLGAAQGADEEVFGGDLKVLLVKAVLFSGNGEAYVGD